MKKSSSPWSKSGEVNEENCIFVSCMYKIFCREGRSGQGMQHGLDELYFYRKNIWLTRGYE